MASLARVGRNWKVFSIVLAGTVLSLVVGDCVGAQDITPILMGGMWAILGLWGIWACRSVEDPRVRTRSRVLLVLLVASDIVFISYNILVVSR
jgi:hypothetical protein